jgi:hypothetical protein
MRPPAPPGQLATGDLPGVCWGCAWLLPGMCLAIGPDRLPLGPRSLFGGSDRRSTGDVPGACWGCTWDLPGFCRGSTWGLPGFFLAHLLAGELRADSRTPLFPGKWFSTHGAIIKSEKFSDLALAPPRSLHTGVGKPWPSNSNRKIFPF